MKVVFSIIIILLIKLSLYSQTTIDDFLNYDYKVNGDVTKIIEESFLVNSDKSIVKKQWDVNWEYDKNIYYDRSNNVTRIEYLDPTGNVLRTDEFTYKNGKIAFRKLKFLTEIYFYENGLLDEIYSEVSQPKIITTGLEKPAPNSYGLKLKHVYDNGLLKNIITYNSRNEEECLATLKYNTTTRQLIEMANDCDGLIEKFEYQYSGENIVQIKWSDTEDGLIEQSDYKYDQGKVVEESWKLYDRGEYSGKVVTKYNNYNEVEITETNENDEVELLTRFEYEYDYQGNWIKKFVLEEDENYLITRQITY